MRAHPNHTTINAASQLQDPTSVFHTWRAVLQARKDYKHIFIYGDFALVDAANPRVFAYSRTARNGSAALVVCNYSAEEVLWNGWEGSVVEVLVGDPGKTVGSFGADGVRLGPYEGVAVLVKKA